jgi:DNA repair exonuclease SbcCD ATPase subunit
MLTVDEQLEQALARVKALESDAEARDLLLSEAQEQVITLQGQLTEANADRERLQADLDALKPLEDQVKTLTERNAALEAKEQDLEKRASARAAEIVASTGSTEPAPVTPKGDLQSVDKLVEQFRAISEPQEQTLFWQSLTPQQQSAIMKAAETV